MTPNRRIALNIVATYGRNLYSLVLGMFTARWALMALGQSDYGLMGLVGGLIAFVTLLNSTMSQAVSRFFAVSVGAAKVDREDGLEACRMWFTTAVVIHTILPTVLVLAGYPVGEWLVRHFLTIPPDRVSACVWLWRFTCIAALVNMMSVPFCAMYTAKQEIAELTLYGFATTTLNAIFLFYMVTHDDVWLVKYAAWTCLMRTIPTAIQIVRAYFIFPECRFLMRYAMCGRQIWKLMGFAGFQLFASIGNMIRMQGVAVVINKYFGPKVNAANAVGMSLAEHCQVLSRGIYGAICPAIMNAYGAGDYDLVRRMAFRLEKIGVLLVLLFALPLALEVDEVLVLWLKNPPPYAGGLCVCVLVMTLAETMGCGHVIALNATGKVAACQTYYGIVLLLTLPLAWWWSAAGYGVYAVGAALALTMCMQTIGAVWFAKRQVGMSIIHMIRANVIPLLGLSTVCLVAGAIPRFWLEQSFVRVCVTTIAVEVIFLPLSWAWVLSAEERQFMRVRFARLKDRLLAEKS